MLQLLFVMQCLLSSRSGLNGVNGNLLLVTAQTLETHNAILQSEQGVIAADAHVQAGMDVSAALTNENVTGQRELTIGALAAQTLAFAVTAVTGRAHTFFMGEKLKIQLQHVDVPPIK